MKGDCIAIYVGGYEISREVKIEATKIGGKVVRDSSSSLGEEWLSFVEENRAGYVLRRYNVRKELVESIDIRLRQKP